MTQLSYFRTKMFNHTIQQCYPCAWDKSDANIKWTNLGIAFLVEGHYFHNFIIILITFLKV